MNGAVLPTRASSLLVVAGTTAICRAVHVLRFVKALRTSPCHTLRASNAAVFRAFRIPYGTAVSRTFFRSSASSFAPRISTLTGILSSFERAIDDRRGQGTTFGHECCHRLLFAVGRLKGLLLVCEQVGVGEP